MMKNFKTKITDNDFEEMFNILITNMKAFNNDLVVNKDDFIIWKNNILKNEQLNNFIQKNENKVIGYIQCQKDKDSYCICEIEILKQYQHDGKTFRSLIKQFVEVYDIKDNSIIYCNINPNNLNSKVVFEGIGFKNTEKNRYEITGKEFLKWYKKHKDNN